MRHISRMAGTRWAQVDTECHPLTSTSGLSSWRSVLTVFKCHGRAGCRLPRLKHRANLGTTREESMQSDLKDLEQALNTFHTETH
jgi:hypothetical protein